MESLTMRELEKIILTTESPEYLLESSNQDHQLVNLQYNLIFNKLMIRREPSAIGFGELNGKNKMWISCVTDIEDHGTCAIGRVIKIIYKDVMAYDGQASCTVIIRSHHPEY